MVSAFTSRHSCLVDQLVSNVILKCADKSVSVKALWDTGATNSCISTDVVHDLALIETGKRSMLTPSGTATISTYLIDVMLPNKVSITDLVVADSEIGAQNIGLLIGMDVIKRGDFAVSHFDNKTTFTFCVPSHKEADYVMSANVKNMIGKHGKGKRKKNKR